MRCDNGCLVISKVRYSCVGDDSYTYDQLKIVQDICEDKTECKVRATRKVFGNSRCPAVNFGEMTLTVNYYCVGGQDRTKVRIRRMNCKSPTTPGDGNCIGGGGGGCGGVGPDSITTGNVCVGGCGANCRCIYRQNQTQTLIQWNSVDVRHIVVTTITNFLGTSRLDKELEFGAYTKLP